MGNVRPQWTQARHQRIVVCRDAPTATNDFVILAMMSGNHCKAGAIARGS
jgi:hypothetical protein